MNTLSIVWDLLIHFFEVMIFYLYISTILTPKEHKNWNLTLGGLLSVQYIAIMIGNAFELNSAGSIILAFLLHFLIAKILFQETFLLCILWVGVHSVLSIIGELISYFLLITLTPMRPTEIFIDDSYHILYTTIYIICLAVLNYWVSTTISRRHLFRMKHKFFVFLTMFFGIVLTHSFMYSMFDSEAAQSEFMHVIVLTNTLFLFFTIFILLYIYELTLITQENVKLQERTKLLELETQQYNNLVETTESLRVIKHDVHHHLATIQSLIQTNDQARLMQYLNEYEEHFNLDYSISATGNIVIDSILSSKTFLAKQQGTKLEFSVILPDSIPFSDVSLSALLGNLFDNALEACKRLPKEKERLITFYMKAQEHMLVIHMENSFDGIVKKDTSDTYLSRKEEPSHGIGLKRVQTLIEEAHGFTEIRHSDTIFTVHIMVPLENKHEF